MANPTTYFGWVMPTSTDLVTDLPADFNVFGQGVDTSMQDLLGGTTGQVLSKTSATNMDFTWVTPTDQTPLTTKGDLFTFSTVDARLGVGTNGQTLVADSTAATGLKWATAAGGGKVLQVIQGTTSTATTNSTAAFIDTTLTASITPSSASSKVLVFVHHIECRKSAANAANGLSMRLLRGVTVISEFGYENLYTNTTLINTGTVSGVTLDEPATTSATTYKTTFRNSNLGAAVTVQNNSMASYIILMEIGA